MSLLGKINSVRLSGSNNIIIQDVNNSTIVLNVGNSEGIGEFFALFENRIDEIRAILKAMPHSIAHEIFFKDSLTGVSNNSNSFSFNPLILEEEIFLLKSLHNDLNTVKTKFLAEATLLKVETMVESKLKSKMLLELYQILSKVYELQGQNRIKGGMYMDLLFNLAEEEKDYKSAISALNYAAINQFNMLFSSRNKQQLIIQTIHRYEKLGKFLEYAENKISKEDFLMLKSNAILCHGAVLALGAFTTEAQNKLIEANDGAMELGEKSRIFPTFQHMGVQCLKEGDLSKAEKYFDKALEYAKFASGPHMVIFNKYLSLFYIKIGNKTKALELAEASMYQANLHGMTDQVKHINIITANIENKLFISDPLSLNFL